MNGHLLNVLGIGTLYAQSEAPQKSPGGGGLGMLLPFLIIIVIMYFLILRPQARRQKQLEAKRKALQKGDSIVTSGGIVGKVSHFKGEGNSIVAIDVGEGTKLQVLRNSISEVMPKGSPEPQQKTEAKKTKT